MGDVGNILNHTPLYFLTLPSRYIHGGAWRDPNITDTSFNPTIEQLVLDSSYNELVEDHVAAFASIDYRLSPHPNFPQDKSTTPPSEYRGAKHPDHIDDVRLAISWLQANHGFGEQYMLVGHSCGATLAFQTVMRDISSASKIKPAIAIAGVAGIYDLRLLRETNTHPEYNRFLTDAFGADLAVWDAASPARYEEFKKWTEGRLVVLASSKDDELIDDPQIDSVQSLSLNNQTKVVDMKKELEGTHDDIWAKGVQSAKVVAKALEELVLKSRHSQ